jgi:hypothetical protein
MIYRYQSFEKIEGPPADESARCYCSFEGEDMKIPEILELYPQARALVHLIIEGYLAAEPDEKSTYWREATEAMVEWMMKKGIVQLVS